MIAQRAFAERVRGRRQQRAGVAAWSVDSNPQNVQVLQSIVHSPQLGLWCACGNPAGDAYLITSPGNGVWTQRSPGIAFAPVLYEVCWTGTHFVATGSAPGQAMPTVIRSADGENWAADTGDAGPIDTTAVVNVGWACEGMANNAGELVAFGENTGAAEGSLLMRSTDHGASWARVGNPNAGDVHLFAGAWTGQDWIGVGQPVGGRWKILTSPDGVTWTSRTAACPLVTGSALAVNAGQGRIVVAGGTGPSSSLVTSDDRGVSWQGPFATPLGAAEGFRRVLYTGRQWIGLTSGGVGGVLTSRDGQSWARLRSAAVGFFGLGRSSSGFMIGVGAQTGASGSLIARMGGLQ